MNQATMLYGSTLDNDFYWTLLYETQASNRDQLKTIIEMNISVTFRSVTFMTLSNEMYGIRLCIQDGSDDNLQAVNVPFVRHPPHTIYWFF